MTDEAKEIGGEVISMMGALKRSLGLPTTDEEWDAHDARVRADLEAARKADAGREAREHRDRMIGAGWPARALDAVAGADLAKPAITRVRAWDPMSDSVLVLSGPPGTGKTTAAAAWAAPRSPIPAFVRATTFAASSRYDQERRSQWLQASALVLDDLGAEYADAKGNFLVDLDELVDTFYADKRPLLVTTNATLDEFRVRYGQRVYDRFRECGAWFAVSGGSMRGKAR